MKPRAKGETQTDQKVLLVLLKAALFSCALTIILILLLALLLKTGLVGEGIIPVANQVIKVVGIALASYLSTRRPMKAVWVKGGVAGVCYIVLGIIVFSLIEGSMTFNLGLLADLAMGFVVGAAIAMITRVKGKSTK